MARNEQPTVSRRTLLRTSAGGAACVAAGATGVTTAQDGDNATGGGGGGGDGGDGGTGNATGETDGQGAGSDGSGPESAANRTAAYTLLGMLALGFLSPIVFALLVRRRMNRGS